MYYYDSVTEDQIMFRFLIKNPFYKKISQETNYILTNAKGDDISYCIIEFGAEKTSWFCKSQDIIIRMMSDDASLPKSGDKVFLTIINSPEDAKSIQEKGVKAFSNIEITIP
jgi:hypothetical protein